MAKNTPITTADGLGGKVDEWSPKSQPAARRPKPVPEQEAFAALDWLTVTATDRGAGNRMLDTFGAYKAGKVNPTNFFGFDCLRDEEGLTWGQRSTDGRYILIAPGVVSGDIFTAMTPLPVKVTRVDLAVDVWLEKARDQVRQSSRVPLSPGYDSRSKAVLITGTAGGKRKRVGDTLYIGSRASTQYGRFYDKGLQQKTAPKGKWLRYEVEYKAHAARQIAEAARGLKPTSLGRWIQCTVYDWFLKRAVVPLFKPDTDTPGTTIRTQYKQTTPQKKLVWLRAQVKPTIKYLFEQGMKNEALAALGIELVEIESAGYNTLARPEWAGTHE